MKKIILFILLFAVMGSCQTYIPGWMVWKYDYIDNPPPYNDSTNVEFDVFYGLSLIDTSYVKLDSTQLHRSTLLEHTFLYNNTVWFLYCRARALSDGAISFNSDTVYAYFPIIIPGKPYQFKILKAKLE